MPCKLGCGKTFCSPGAECTHRKRCHPESFAPYSRSFDTPIAAPSLYNDPTESYTAGPSPSSSSVYTQQPIPCELHGVFIALLMCKLIVDQYIDQLPDISHQEASSANHLEAAQSALGRAPDARTPLYPSRQGAPTSSHPGIGRGAGVCVASHIDHCDGDRGVEDPLPLMTGQRFPNVVQVQGENFLIPRSGHVPSYDKTRTRRMPLSPSLPPNPGMLF